LTGLVVPDELVETTIRWNGERGRRWIEDLPATVGEFARRWDLRIGDVYEPGACALVLRAERAGEPVVLKVSWVDDETRDEADALRYWDGDGAVRLLDADPVRGVLLLERLEPGTPLGDLADRDEAISIACGLLRHMWRSPPSDHRLLFAHELAGSWLAEFTEDNERLGRPFHSAVIDAANEAARELAHPPPYVVIANRDFHLFNVLAAQRAPWLVIDPKPVAGEPAFDTGYLLADILQGDPRLSPVARCSHRLAEELDLDESRIRAWALLRAVDNAFWDLRVGEAPTFSLMLARALATLSST
jgi:streptomycin 6-kinase